MKLKITGKVGLLAAGSTHYTRTDEEAKRLIDAGLAELHPEQDAELPELKRELYQAEDGGWHTRDNHGNDSGKFVSDEPVTEVDTKPKKDKK